MVISQVKAEKAALRLGLGQDFVAFLNHKLSYRIFMSRISSKRKGRVVDRQAANDLEEFVTNKR